MSELNPVGLFLWIMFLEVASVPIIAFLYGWISNIRYSKNRELLGEVLKVLGSALKEMAKERKKKSE